MKKVFKVNNLDCAHCAAKMETNLAKLSGVKECSMNFIMQKLTIAFEDGSELDTWPKVVAECVRRDCPVVGEDVRYAQV